MKKAIYGDDKIISDAGVGVKRKNGYAEHRGFLGNKLFCIILDKFHGTFV